MWYSQQAEERSAPGYPLGYGVYGGVKLVKVVGNDDDGDEDVGSGGDGGMPKMVDAAGKGFPLDGRESRILLGDN